ncbi:ThuA domain-containing protein [Herbidospora daliensis]|uniref:ThuA domain-containing protein n=1 Tax=Herbidospora daliensis TaxID=295585 RepID=UPI0007847B36|nr:ThuA domain-containing protein [Herbidospora daliensis]
MPALLLGTPGVALAAETGAPPVLDVATLSPVHPVPNYNGVANNAYVTSTSTGPGGWFTGNDVTLNLSATDDDAVNLFRVTVAGVTVEVPAVRNGNRGTAQHVISGDRNGSVSYVAVDAAGNASASRSITVRIDTKVPVAAWPGIPNGKVAHSALPAAITPTRTDPTPGAGGAAVRDMWIDGVWTYPMPLDLATLSVGQHTWAVNVGDSAGNAAKYTLTFEITTSIADLRALVQRYVTAGKVSAANGNRLLALLTEAEAGSAEASLVKFGALAAKVTPAGYMRDSLVKDAAWLVEELQGVDHPDVVTGVAVSAGQGMERYPFRAPGEAVRNNRPKFKVLLFGNRPGAFRHEHIPATMAMIQDLGRANSFDVDVYDYLSPEVSVAGNPFESAERLSQYDALIGVSSVGNDVFVTNRPSTTTPGATVDEQAALQTYIRNGGGFVAIHGATDSMHNWDWYKNLVGGEFDNHGSNAGGIQNTCGGCVIGELVTEDDTHPSTRHFEKKMPVMDELYNWRGFLPREKVHVLQTLTESTYVSGIGNSAGRVEGADHPISWCANYDGGRSFTQALMHNWKNTADPIFQKNILEGIKWAAGATSGNCVTHVEMRALVAAGVTDGSVDTALAATLNGAIDASYNAYLVKDYVEAMEQAKVVRREVKANLPGADNTPIRERAKELAEWMKVLADEAIILRFQSEPVSATHAAGDDAVFAAPAEGQNVAYQWQVKAPGSADWADVAGQTSFAIALTATPELDGSEYRVRATDPTGEIVSRSAVLRVG